MIRDQVQVGSDFVCGVFVFKPPRLPPCGQDPPLLGKEGNFSPGKRLPPCGQDPRGCLKSQIPYQVRNDAIRLLLRQPH